VLAHESGAAGLAAADIDARVASVVAEHRERLLRLCSRRLGGDRHLAEDVVQETFLKLGRALANGQEITNVGGWLRTVAQNGTVDELRRTSSLVVSEVPERAVDAGFTADGSPELEVAWQGLTDRHRQVLQLREVDGLKYDEIAAAMSTRVSAVETLLFRARAALRREYARASAAMSASAPAQVALPAKASRWSDLWQGTVQRVRLGEVRSTLLLEKIDRVLSSALGRAGEVAAGAAIVGGTIVGPAAPATPPIPAVPPIEAPALPAAPATPAPPAMPAAPAAPDVPEVPVDAPATAPAPERPAPAAGVTDAVDDVLAPVDELLGGASELVEKILGSTARIG
jgi:RNA polymerase sigma factor (sigma-70 family)